MMKNTTWTLAHVAHWVLIYIAFFRGSEGAMNVLKFLCWINAVLSLWFFCDVPAIEEAKLPPKSPIKSNMWLLRAWASVVLFAWFSCVFTATAVAFSAFAFSYFLENVKSFRKKAV